MGQPRQPKGTATGGEFAASQHAESVSRLDHVPTASSDAALAAVDEEINAAWTARWQAESRLVEASLTGIDVAVRRDFPDAATVEFAAFEYEEGYGWTPTRVLDASGNELGEAGESGDDAERYASELPGGGPQPWMQTFSDDRATYAIGRHAPAPEADRASA